MILSKYKIEDYVNPGATYSKLSNKVKIGQPILNKNKKIIEIIDLIVLERIITAEKDRNKEQVYSPLPINKKWLTNIFHFEEKHLVPQNMTVYTSKIHGLKIHLFNRQFRVGYIIRERIKGAVFSGASSTKPLILTVNELMDHLYLIKREQIEFTEEDIPFLNEVFSPELSQL